MEYVEATACQSTQEENGAEYVWTLRANVNTMWEAAIDAEKRVLLSPEIVGLNGEWDEQTGEWTSWN